MPLSVAAAVNYPSPLTAIPSNMQDEPIEGRKQVSLELLWGTMGGAAKCINVNLQNNAALNISQISTLKVDNSQSAADVTFIFTDTSETIVFPAGTPLSVVPVFSNATQFFISAPNGAAGDVTRAQLLNYRTFPADIPMTTERQSASSGGTVITQATNQRIQLIPVGVNGTLEDLNISLSIPNAPSAPPVQFVMTVNDGSIPTPRVLINQFNFSLSAAQNWLTLVEMNNINWRFTNGVGMQIQGISGTGSAIINALASYTQP